LPTPLRLVAAAFGVVTLAASPLGPIINTIVIGMMALQAIQFGGKLITGIVTMKAVFSGFLAFLTTTIGPSLLAFFSGPVGWTVLAVAAVVTMAVAFREPIMKFLSWLPGALKAGFDVAWAGVQAGFVAVSEAFNTYVATPIRQTWMEIVEFLPRGMASVANTVQKTWTNILNGIRNAFNGFLRGIANGINSITGGINSLIRTYNRLPSSPDLPLVPQFSVPRFATGAYVTNRTLAEIAEGGEPEYVVPKSKAVSFANNIVAGRQGAQALKPAKRQPLSGTVKQSQQRQMMFGPTRTGSAVFAHAAKVASAPIVIAPKLTGPIIELNGQKSVSYEDLERAMTATAEGVFARLRTPQARRAVGIR